MPRESFEQMNPSEIEGAKEQTEPKIETQERDQKLKEDLMRNKAMYNLPGFPEISIPDIQRYVRSNEKISSKLPGMIQQGLEDQSWDVRLEAAAMIEHAPEEEQSLLREKLPELIQQGLEGQNWYIRLKAVEMIKHAPEEARAKMIQQGLKDQNWEVRRQAAAMIEHLSLIHI